MIHINKSTLFFNIPEYNFNSDKLYTSYSYLGNFKFGNRIGPVGSNAISKSRTMAIKKSFSESLERRALMLGGVKNKESNLVPTFDLISSEISQLPYEYTTYRTEKPNSIDTTGTAAHINSELAVKKALLELIEKNALFLFWYGKKGYILEQSLYNKHYINERIEKKGFNVKLFVNTDFHPLKVVFAVIFDNNIIYSAGVGCSINIAESINLALEEAYLLKWQNIYVDFIALNHKYKKKIDLNYHKSCIMHLKSIENYYQGKLDSEYDYCTEKEGLELILSAIPNWVKNIHVIYLTSLIRNIKVVKIFSEELYNHIPVKNLIDLSHPINREILSLTENEIRNIPECIIV